MARTEPSSTEVSASSSSASNNHSNHTASDPSPAAASMRSMSELAPLVAAVLRDQVVMDSVAAIEESKEERLRVEILGPDGIIYYRASLKDGGLFSPGPDHPPLWLVPIFYSTIPNFIEIVTRGEIRLGGIVVWRFREEIFSTGATEENGFDRTRDDEKQMRSVGFNLVDDRHSRTDPVQRFSQYLATSS